MPPKRNTTEKKQQATVQDTEEIQTGSGGHGLGLGLAGLGTGTDPGLPASKPQWLETVLEGLTNKFSLAQFTKIGKYMLDTLLTSCTSQVQ